MKYVIVYFTSGTTAHFPNVEQFEIDMHRLAFTYLDAERKFTVIFQLPKIAGYCVSDG